MKKRKKVSILKGVSDRRATKIFRAISRMINSRVQFEVDRALLPTIFDDRRLLKKGVPTFSSDDWDRIYNLIDEVFEKTMDFGACGAKKLFMNENDPSARDKEVERDKAIAQLVHAIANAGARIQFEKFPTVRNLNG